MKNKNKNKRRRRTKKNKNKNKKNKNKKRRRTKKNKNKKSKNTNKKNKENKNQKQCACPLSESAVTGITFRACQSTVTQSVLSRITEASPKLQLFLLVGCLTS